MKENLTGYSILDCYLHPFFPPNLEYLMPLSFGLQVFAEKFTAGWMDFLLNKTWNFNQAVFRILSLSYIFGVLHFNVQP